MRAWAAAFLGVLALQASAARAEGCKLGKIADFPVTMVGLQPLIHTKVNGTDALFMVDSGAFFSMISAPAAAQLGLRTAPFPFGYRVEGVGGEADASVATVKTFTLADVPIKNVEFIVGGGEVGGGAVGLLGQNVLRLADVEYDLGAGAIRLMRPHDCDNTNMAYWASGKPYGLLPLRWADRQQPHTLGQVEVNGVPMQAMFDTGASTSVLDTAAARRAGIRTDGPDVTFAGYSHGIGRRPVKTWIAQVKSFGIGGELVKNTRLRIGDIGMDGAAQMLVGADFFLSHRAYVANAQRKMYFTYNGGPVFDLRIDPDDERPPSPAVTSAASAPKAEAGPSPSDADGFSRRAAAAAARGDWTHAVADFTRAAELEPKEPRHLYRRAQARLSAHQPESARKDLDAALALKPDDPDARVLRAEVRLADDDKSGAIADIDAADKAAPPRWDERLTLASLDTSAGRYPAAVAQLDLWIASHRDDSRMSTALNERCWARAQGGMEFDKALADCNAALRLLPHTSGYLDSRGLVHLRRGEFALAIADYDAVLASEPKMAWSLYGRGVAKEKLGRKAEGEADLAAAAVLAPKLPERAKALGIAP